MRKRGINTLVEDEWRRRESEKRRGVPNRVTPEGFTKCGEKRERKQIGSVASSLNSANNAVNKIN